MLRFYLMHVYAMRDFMIYIIILLLGFRAVQIDACQMFGPVTLEEKARYSQIIVTGEIVKKYDNYTYSLQVLCILKDTNINISSVFNISHAVLVADGMCFTNNFIEGHQYVVFLRYIGGEYHPSYKELPKVAEANVSKVCGLHAKTLQPQNNIGGTTVKCIDVNSISKPCPSTTAFIYTARTKRPRPTKPRRTTAVTSRTTQMNHISTTKPKGSSHITKKPRPSTTKNPNKGKEHNHELKSDVKGVKLYRNGSQRIVFVWVYAVIPLLITVIFYTY